MIKFTCKNLGSKMVKFVISPPFFDRGLSGVRARNPDATTYFVQGKRGGMAAFFLLWRLCPPWIYRARGPKFR